jgi:hypothetical protein
VQRRYDPRCRPHTQPDASLLGEVSTETLQLHLCSALVSADTERPGFVPDAFLAAIDEDITLALIEVELAGLWRREAGGYQIPPRELRRVITTLRHLLSDL